MGLTTRLLKIDDDLLREALLPAFDAARASGHLAPLLPFFDKVALEERTGRVVSIQLETERRFLRKNRTRYVFTLPPLTILLAAFEQMAADAVCEVPSDLWGIPMPAGWHALTMAKRGVPRAFVTEETTVSLVAVEEVPALCAIARRVASSMGSDSDLAELVAFLSSCGPRDCVAVLR